MSRWRNRFCATKEGSALRRISRGRIRDQRTLCWRALQTGRGRHRADLSDQTDGRREGRAPQEFRRGTGTGQHYLSKRRWRSRVTGCAGRPPPAKNRTKENCFLGVRFCVLASGSAGNSAFLATSRTRILIDSGLSVRELTRRLAEIGEKPEDLDAVVITHEHADWHKRN